MPRKTGGQENIKVTHLLGKRGGSMFEPRDCKCGGKTIFVRGKGHVCSNCLKEYK